MTRSRIKKPTLGGFFCW